VRLFSQSLTPPSFFLLASLLAGIVLGKYIPGVFLPWLISLFFVLVIIIVCGLKKHLILFGHLVFFLFGVYSIQTIIFPGLPPHHIYNYTGKDKVIITARVTGFKKHYTHRTRLTVLCQSIAIKEQPPVAVTGRLQLTLYGTFESSDKEPQFNDVIQFSSAIRPIRNFLNPGGFDYVTYMKFRRLHATAYSNIKGVRILFNSDSHIGLTTRIIRKIENHRNNFHSRILWDHTQNMPSGRILTALVTGKKEAITQDLRDMFSKAGISHLLAISGLHLSIVGGVSFLIFYHFIGNFTFWAARGNARKTAWLVSLLPLTFYAVFSGFSPSTQRAYIMITAFVCALVFEREKDLVSSLFTAAIIILLIDSAALFSISFQLSFFAVLFIICGLSMVNPILIKCKNRLVAHFASIVLVTFFAGLGTLPLTAFYFHTISHVQLFSNIIAVPVTGFVVLSLGLTAFCLSGLWPIASDFLIDISLGLIRAVIDMASYLNQIPFAWQTVPNISFGAIFSFYLTMALIYFYIRYSSSKKRDGLLLVITILSFFCISFLYRIVENKESSNMEITVLDIGQGNSTVVQTPDNNTILIDGGGFSDMSRFDTGRFIVAPFLWQHNIRSIDTVVLTHPESDHMNGLIYVLKTFTVKNLIKNQDVKHSKKYAQLMAACKNKATKIINPSSLNRVFRIGNTKLTFFVSQYPESGYNLNNNSLVFKLNYQNFSMLFPGDILKQRETHLAGTFGAALQSDFLLAPHHGSNTSSSKVFLDQVQAKSVIISCGFNNRYGFPHTAVLERYKKMGTQVWRTDSDGAARIEINGFYHQIKTYKGGL